MKYVLIVTGLVLVSVVVFVLFSSQSFITEKTSDQNREIKITQLEKLPIEGRGADPTGIVDWINSEPLTGQDLRGKVVLVDFWTYSCINCIRTLPYVEGWYEKYKDSGFIVLGVHTPEFDFEKKKENVEEAIKNYNLTYPVAMDNNYVTWDAYSNRYWPAHYLLDVDGNIRFKHFGEGRYEETERAIQQLLLEAGLLSLDKIAEIKEQPTGVDFSKIGTPEIYLGFSRLNNIGNLDGRVLPNELHNFSLPEEIKFNRFYLDGQWQIFSEFAELVGQRGKIILRYRANKVNMVLASTNSQPIEIEAILDGKRHKIITVTKSDLYNLVDTGEDYGEHTLEIIIKSPGLRAFTFTFG